MIYWYVCYVCGNNSANKCACKTELETLKAENERLKEQLLQRLPTFTIAHNSDTEMLRSQITKLTEQNRELESIISKRVPKLEKILSIMKEALASYVRWCPFGCVEGDCGAEWDAEPKPCDACKPAREALAAVKKLEEK